MLCFVLSLKRGRISELISEKDEKNVKRAARAISTGFSRLCTKKHVRFLRFKNESYILNDVIHAAFDFGR